MWKKQIITNCAAATFSNPSNNEFIKTAERALRTKFPSQLYSLLLETNGCQGEYDLGLIWSLEKIVEINNYFRKSNEFKSIYMSFDNLLFFADAGNGGQFFFPISANKNTRDSVFIWSHEDDSRSWVAPDLATYIDWWLSGKLEI